MNEKLRVVHEATHSHTPESTLPYNICSCGIVLYKDKGEWIDARHLFIEFEEYLRAIKRKTSFRKMRKV